MKYPQTISISGDNADAVMAVWGEDVIDDNPDDSQAPMGDTVSLINIDINLYDLTSNAGIALAGIAMTYDSDSKFWLIPCASGTTLGDALTDRHKYVARVSDSSGSGAGCMREFSLEEFAVDNDSFEEMLARLPYQVEIDTPQSYIVWYDSDSNIGIAGNEMYKAPIYEGGVGTTSATDASRVTHRGAIVPF